MLRFVLVTGMLLASEAFAPRARTVRGRAALYARDPERAARFKAQTLSRATDAKARATARAEGRPMEPERETATIKVADFSDADYARNGFIRKVLFGVAGAAFIGLELETLANGQSKGTLFPELYTPWNYSGSNDQICAEDKAKGVKSSFEGKGLCTEANLKKNAGVKTKVPLKDSTESVATLRYKK